MVATTRSQSASSGGRMLAAEGVKSGVTGSSPTAEVLWYELGEKQRLVVGGVLGSSPAGSSAQYDDDEQAYAG